MRTLQFEQWSLRDGETITVHTAYPADAPRVLAARTVPVSFPGDHAPVCETGQPVELAALVFAERTAKGWQWAHVTPTTKSVLGSILKDGEFRYEEGTWVYFAIEMIAE